MSSRLKLVLLSFLMLFVELALIRWLGSNILYLSYFSNFVLLGSFLGIGLGFLRSNDKKPLYPFLPYALTVLVLVVLKFPVQIDRTHRDLIFFGGEPTGLPAWVMLPVVFLAVAAILMMIGDGVSRVFAQFEPLEAYRLDILGSILGIVAFSACSFLRAPPLAWGIVAAVLIIITMEPRVSIPQVLVLVVLVGGLFWESRLPNTSFSPYYKITTSTHDDGGIIVNDISVNGLPHQTMYPVAERIKRDPVYNQPYDLRSPQMAPLDDVLIIGAGSGNDVALALSRGAKHVDAVEIDPRLNEIGKEIHPSKPYDDPRVTVHINDGRAFLHNTDKKYDLVVLALPDSLTLVSGQSSLRLESFLFTEDAFQEIRDHLKPDGEFTMYNFYREPWLRDRYANTVREVYGHEPCVTTVDAQNELAIITVTKQAASIPNCPAPRNIVSDVPPPSTDNHPFPYLRDNVIPSIYLIAIALILLVAIALVRVFGGPLRKIGRYTDLFFMGVAFLLLETKSVVQFALLFGTTWFVNALVFAGVLVSVYCAVELAKRVTLPKPVLLYGALLASLIITWLVPLDSLLGLAAPLRFASAVLLAFTPIFIANLVFAQRFADVGNSTTAFGANLLGAMFGGCIEYVALVTGYKNLLILVAIFYGCAFLYGQMTWMKKAPGIADPVPIDA